MRKVIVTIIVLIICATAVFGREIILRIKTSDTTVYQRKIEISDRDIVLGDVVKVIGKKSWYKNDYYFGEIVKITDSHILLSCTETSTQWLPRNEWEIEIYLPLEDKCRTIDLRF